MQATEQGLEPAPIPGANLRRDYVTTFLTEVLVIASYLVAFRLVAIRLGVAGFGEYALTRRNLALISPLVVVGLDVAIARYVAFATHKRASRPGGYAAVALLVMAVTVGIACALLLLFPALFANLLFGSPVYAGLVRALTVMLAGSSLHLIAYGFLRGRSQIQLANLLMALNHAVVPVAAVYLGKDVPQILLLMGAGWIVISSVYLALAGLTFERRGEHMRELLRFGLPRVPGDFLQLALFALPGILVAHVVDVKTAGIVAFGVAALGMVGTALTPISFVLLPAVTGLFARGWGEQVRQRVIEVVRLAVPALVAGTLVLEFFAKPIIADYLGNQFAAGADVLRVIMIAALPWGLYVILKSVIDARYVRPINARNMAIAFATFVLVALVSRLFTSSYQLILVAFVSALFVLGALTVVEVFLIVVRGDSPDTRPAEDAVPADVAAPQAGEVVEADREAVSADRMGRFLRDLEMYLQDTGLLLLPLLSVSVILLLLGAWAVFGQSILLVGLTTLLSIVSVTVIIQLDLNRRAQVWNYRQIESLFSIYSALSIVQPLPPMRGWGVSPDFASLVVSLIHEVKPDVIVEAGSGVSTLVAAYTLKKEGSGLIVSLDQDEKYAEITRANVNRHGLGDFASVRYAPLRRVMIGTRPWLWYDLDKVQDLKAIDMLIVDGPPGNIQRLARYPALPLLLDRLSDRAVIVLDDCFRHAEKEILARWLRDYPGLTHQVIGTEKVTVILRKSGPVVISPMETKIPFLDVAVPRIQD
ncbi:MAG TPA: class I SAM-dependent methyltransferase [Candidatus Dormibacteraeota bacterium]|nr:class I SAM-dependent methyltransferase [Candidatus Dormibacteraeota bacterium]